MQGNTLRALIFGITGPDGAYLSDFLLHRGYEVHGTSRNPSGNLGNLRRLGIEDRVRVHSVSVEDFAQVAGVVKTVQPSEIYNLAGQSWVGQSFVQPKEAISSNINGTLNILEAIRLSAPETRFYSAASSETFGDAGTEPATVGTPLRAPEQSPNREEALRMYSLNATWFSFDDDKRGSLEPGKYADLAVLSDDYMTVPVDKVGEITSLLTLVGGKAVYGAGPFVEREGKL